MSEEQKKESTAVVQKEKPAPIQVSTKGLNLTTIEDMYRFAQYIVAAGLAPKGMEKPESVVIALEMGMEVGLAPMQSIQNICVVNGRATIWGDAVPALVHNSKKQEYYTQKKIGTPGTDSYGYEVTSKRKGNPEPIVTTFTVAEAKKANLWGKSGPWMQYPDRMLLNRARAFNARDNFPDVLKGMYTTEEMQDVEFEVLDSKPLEDGEKTNRLADRLAEKVAPAEVVNEDTGEVAQEAPVQEPVKRGRPPKQEATDSKTETVPEATTPDYIALLKQGHSETEIIRACKALSIRKFMRDFTQEDAQKVLEWLEQNEGKVE